MSVNVRGWTVSKEIDAIPTPQGPLTCRRGDFVMVIVAPSLEEATKIAAIELTRITGPDGQK